MKYVLALAALFVAALYFLSSEKQKQEYKNQLFRLSGKLKAEIKKGAKKAEDAIHKGVGYTDDEAIEITGDFGGVAENVLDDLD